MLLDSRHPLVSRTAGSRLVRAYRGTRPDVLPVWFMRQAGRSLPEYRERRGTTTMLQACLDPVMAAELTVQPVRRHGVDAAVFFSDIVVPLRLAGVDVDIVPGTGPVLAEPIRSAADVAALPAPDADFAPIAEGVRQTVAELGATPLVGFAGAPFTLACYLVEGGPSKDHLRTRALMHGDPQTWHALVTWAADLTGRFLAAQALAGASAVQLFDSWAGTLSADDYERFAAPASARALRPVRELDVPQPTGSVPRVGERLRRTVMQTPDADHVPIVHFGVGTQALLPAMREVGADVVGVDYRTPLDEASAALGFDVPVQGNIDPALLSAPWLTLQAHVADVIDRGRHAIAHVVNLGHGVPPGTDPGVLTRIVELVHGYPR